MFYSHRCDEDETATELVTGKLSWAHLRLQIWGSGRINRLLRVGKSNVMYEIMAVKKEVKISDITQSEKELLKKRVLPKKETNWAKCQMVLLSSPKKSILIKKEKSVTARFFLLQFLPWKKGNDWSFLLSTSDLGKVSFGLDQRWTTERALRHQKSSVYFV